MVDCDVLCVQYILDVIDLLDVTSLAEGDFIAISNLFSNDILTTFRGQELRIDRFTNANIYRAEQC